MKTTRSKPAFLRNTDRNSVMVRLERSNKNLVSLNSKLSSYNCEPKTLTLFERKQSLKNRLDGMRTSNQEIINAIKGHKQFLEDPLERIKQQGNAFKELEKSVLEYIGIAKQLC